MAKIVVIELSSGDQRSRIPDFADLRSRGVVGVVHRATESLQFTDPLYKDRREAALAAGMLWGASHTIDASDAEAQGQRFLDTIGLTDPRTDMNATLLAVDYTALPIAQPAALSQLYAFCGFVDRNTPFGVSIVIKSDTYIRETLKPIKDAPGVTNGAMIGAASFMAKHRFWTLEEQFGNMPTPKSPFPWAEFFLRRVTPFPPDAIIGKFGVNYYDGDAQTLRDNWSI